MEKSILHIDFDSFFASVEQQFRPELRGKPIGVTAANGRTCIIAASRESKKRGVTHPMNTEVARRRIPEITFIKADFVKYWEVSKKFISICKDFSPYIEVFSIDELFMDVTLTAQLFGGIEPLIAKLKHRIKTEIGEYITVSVGISYNKLLAKLGSGLQKPNGMVFINRENVASLYEKTPLAKICGIGFRIEERLNTMGIYTLSKLHNTPLHSLIAEFGNVEGRFLWNVGQGEDAAIVKSYTSVDEAKSIGRQHCLSENQYDDRIVFQNIYELAEEIGLKLRRLNLKARMVGCSLYGSISVSVHKSSSTYVDTGKEIFDLCSRLIQSPGSGYYSIEKEQRYTRRIGVWVGSLENKQHITIPMFTDEVRKDRLMATIDKINDKFGDHTIRNGFLLYARKLTTVPNGFGPDTWEKQKLATAF